MGFDVLALDVSRVAVDYVRDRARRERERGQSLRAETLDVQRETLPAGPFEVVLNTFFLERGIFGALREALAPGGLLFFVTFLEGSFALRPGELREEFSALEIVDYREGPPLPGDRPRASLVARKAT
jgi:hypothetical protein